MEVQLTNDKEIGAYQVFLMTEAGCQESVTFEYSNECTLTGFQSNQGEMFAKAYKQAHDWADEHKCSVSSVWK